MKALIVVVIAALILMAGCQKKPQAMTHNQFDEATVAFGRDANRDNAIIAQQALFPYHFEHYSADLNDLGFEDICILAAYYRHYSGVLKVRKGDAEEQLYKERVDTVIETLADAGVDMKRLRVINELPGGDGMISERVVKILENENQKEAAQYKSRGGSYVNAGNMGAGQ